MEATIKIVENYSDKSFVVIGETKAIKDQLKELGGRLNYKLSCGVGWVFSNKRLDIVKAALSGDIAKCMETPTKMAKTTNKWADNLKEYAATENSSNYQVKNSIGAIKIDDKFILLEKPSIETRFCFHDEGVGYEHYKEVHKNNDAFSEYFLYENRREYENYIDCLKSGKKVFISHTYAEGIPLCNFYTREYEWQSKYREWDTEATPEQVEDILNALEWALSLFEKRLQTYLKRYGVSKLNTWTYWADR